MTRIKSPYSAAITGGGFLFDETNILLPLLMSEDSEALLKKERNENQLLKINRETSRDRVISEVKRRFNTMSRQFWTDYQAMSEEAQRTAIFYVILKTYKICFDFQINVTLNRWRSINRTLCKQDLIMEINEIGARDEFVDSWSDNTRDRLAKGFLSILRKAGILDDEGNLHPLRIANEDMAYYIRIGEQWFLEACLLQPYEINEIRLAV